MSFVVNAYVDEMMTVKYKVAYHVNNLCKQFCSESGQHHYICQQVRYLNKDILAYHPPPRTRHSSVLPEHKLFKESTIISEVQLHSATVHLQGNETLLKSSTEFIYCNSSVLEHSIPLMTCPIVCQTAFSEMSIDPQSTATERSIANESIDFSFWESQCVSEMDSIFMSTMSMKSSTCTSLSESELVLVEIQNAVELITNASPKSYGDQSTDNSDVLGNRQPVQSIISKLPAIYNQLKYDKELSSHGHTIQLNYAPSVQDDAQHYAALITGHIYASTHIVISLLLLLSLMLRYKVVIRMQSKMFDPGINNYLI